MKYEHNIENPLYVYALFKYVWYYTNRWWYYNVIKLIYEINL